MNAITSLIPRSRPVRIERAGLSFQVSEFTLNDMADLQAVLDGQWTDPLAEIEGELDAAQGIARSRLLAAAYERAEVGPPIYGEPSGRPFYASLEGQACFLWVALRKHQPGFTPENAATLTASITPGEYSQIWRIAHGANTLKTIERMLGMGAAQAAGREVTWGELIEEVVSSHPGWTYADVYGMTVSEFINARRGGKPIEAGVPIPMDASMAARIAEQRAMWAAATGQVQATDGGAK